MRLVLVLLLAGCATPQVGSLEWIKAEQITALRESCQRNYTQDVDFDRLRLGRNAAARCHMEALWLTRQ